MPRLFPALLELVKTQYNVDPQRIYSFWLFRGRIRRHHHSRLLLDRAEAQRKTPIAIYIGDHAQVFFTQATRGNPRPAVGHGISSHEHDGKTK